MSSNTRATRSRYSSPAHQGAAAAAPTVNSPLEISKSSGNDASRSFMQRWLEPSVQTKASFEEAGLVRYGVLEGMAPLGALPKVKKPENGAGTGSISGVRKITLKISSSASAAKESNGTSSGAESSGDKSAVSLSGNAVAGRKRAASPGARTATTASTSSRRSLPSKAAAKKKEDDDEYNPKGAQRKKSARRSQAVDKAQETEGAGADQAAPPVAGLGNHSALSPGLQHYPTAWALRTLYDEKSEDPEFDSLVTDVLQQTADDDTLDEFSKQIGEKKRDGKGDNQDCYYFTPPSTTTTSSRFQPQKGKPAQYGELVGDSEDEEEIEEPEELPAADAEVGAVESEVEGDRRAAKKAKTSHSSSCSLGPGGDALVGAGHSGSAAHHDHHNRNNHDNHSTQNVADTPSRKRRRRNSASSDSSLSSAMTVPSPQQVRIKLATTGASSAGGGAGSAGGNFSTTATTHARGATSATASTPQTQKHNKQPKQASKSKPRAKAAKDGQDSESITKPAAVATSGKRRQAASKAASSEEPSSPPPTSPTTNIHSSRTHLAVSRLAASSDLLSRLPKTKSKTAKTADTLSDSDAPMQQQNPADGQRKGSEELTATWNRRRDAKTVTNNYTAADSSVRIPDQQQRAVTPVSKTRTTRRSLAAAAASVTTRTTRSATKRPNDDVDRNVSPVPFSLTGDDASSTIGSRAVTPVSQRQTKRPKGLRVKSSPVKKSGGPAGGLPRLASESQSSFRAGTPKDPATDNDEFCSACGNAGDVLCCDGCPRSFHFECVNLAQSEDLPDEWYCNECIVRRFPSRVPIHRGAFATVLNHLEKSIPRAFSLPKRIQNRFEGVKAAPDGDYEEVASKTAKKKTGFDEMPDLFKQRDENQPVLCHACQKPSGEARAIIPCSVCSFYWHLDCLDPPLAVPPVLKSWRCPTHVDDVLAEAPRLAPAHKFRRVKNAPAIAPIFTRGTRNNGHIEIDWTDHESEQKKNKLRDAAAGWPDPNSFGRTYKVSANGVILDFIEQLRRQGAGYGARQNEQKWVPYPSPAPQLQQCESINNSSSFEERPLLGSTLGRTVDEMQASLNLIALKRKQSDNIDQLTSALLSQADENVLSLMARGNADNIALGQLTPNDELSLRATLAQMDAMSSYIRQLLGDEEKHNINSSMKHVSSMPTPDPTAPTPPPPSLPLMADSAETAQQAMAMSSPMIAPKKEEMSGMTAMASLPEPTPPLTIDGGDGSMDLD